MLKALVRHMCLRWEEIKLIAVQSCHISEVFRSSVIRDMLGLHHPKERTNLLHLKTLIIKKKEQCLVGFFRFWKQHYFTLRNTALTTESHRWLPASGSRPEKVSDAGPGCEVSSPAGWPIQLSRSHGIRVSMVKDTHNAHWHLWQAPVAITTQNPRVGERICQGFIIWKIASGMLAGLGRGRATSWNTSNRATRLTIMTWFLSDPPSGMFGRAQQQFVTRWKRHIWKLAWTRQRTKVSGILRYYKPLWLLPLSLCIASVSLFTSIAA